MTIIKKNSIKKVILKNPLMINIKEKRNLDLKDLVEEEEINLNKVPKKKEKFLTNYLRKNM